MDLLKSVIFFTTMFFSCIFSNVNPLKHVSMNNQECKIRPEIVNVISDEWSGSCNKCSGSCNNINDPFTKFCVPNIIKNINLENVNNQWNKIHKMSWNL